MSASVCAVVVTFHPRQEDIANLAFICQQVERVVVVDNGSGEMQLSDLRETCRRLNLHLIENGKNLGIASALNYGIQWALSQGFKWVVFFDQDSEPTSGLVDELLSAFVNHPRREKIGIMIPAYVDARSGAPQGTVYADTGDVLVAQTSGSLMPTEVFEKEGWFDEDFFIDCVDYEYCLRIRNRGWIIEECKSAVLMHKPGSARDVTYRGRHLFTTTDYSPLRRYYRTRNILWMLWRYRKTQLRFCVYLNWCNLIDVATIVGEDDKIEKVRAVFRGCMDGFSKITEASPALRLRGAGTGGPEVNSATLVAADSDQRRHLS